MGVDKPIALLYNIKAREVVYIIYNIYNHSCNTICDDAGGGAWPNLTKREFRRSMSDFKPGEIIPEIQHSK